MSSAAPILDQYAGLAHKTPLATSETDSVTSLAPGWVPKDDKRRLDAYKILAAYVGNVARVFLDAAHQDDAREYGDAHLIVKRVVQGVLGDEPEIVIDGASDDLTEGPLLPPAPDEPAEGASDAERRIYDILTAHRDALTDELIDEWEAALADQPSLVARQQWLRDWADDEGWWGKLHEAESDAVGLGDTVYEIRLSETAGRPKVTVHDPGFYFPVLPDDDLADYPTRVHLAWEFVDELGRTKLRRKTWEIAPIDYPLDVDGQFIYTPDGDVVGPDTFEGVLQEQVDDFTFRRHYPWAPDDQADPDYWSTVTCLFSDGVWDLSNLGDTTRGLDALSDGAAEWQPVESGQVAYRLDLGMDFIPVVHEPNTPASVEHFGQSILSVVVQLLDDIRAGDTDLTLASALAAVPMIHASGVSASQTIEVEPGAVFTTTAEGSMTVVDVSGALAELRQLCEDRLGRLSVNAQVPEEILGRVNSGDSKSGVQMAFGLAPFGQVIDLLRIIRDRKHPLVLKMVQRIAQLGGWLEPGPTPRARIAYGSWLPTDRKALVDEAVGLLGAHAASARTVLRMLQDAGVPIADISDELDKIRREDIEAAQHLADATGSEQLAAQRLGLELPSVPSGGGSGAPNLDLTPPEGQ